MLSQNQLISTLEDFIRKFYKNQLIKGVALILVILLPLFLLFTFLEYQGHFSQGVRAVLFFLFVLVGLASLFRYILRPLFKLYGLGRNRLSHKQAAAIIGNHFQEIQDKLLNTLQLSGRMEQGESNELLLAGINQKMQEMKPFNFSLAINRKERKKMLRLAGLALLLLISVSVFQGNVVFEGSERLINYNPEYIRQAPFLFPFNVSYPYNLLYYFVFSF